MEPITFYYSTLYIYSLRWAIHLYGLCHHSLHGCKIMSVRENTILMWPAIYTAIPIYAQTIIGVCQLGNQ